MKKALAIIVIATSAMAFASNGHGEKKAEMKAKMAAHKQEVTQACAADAEKAGCAGKEVGGGLMKCLHAFKKSNKDFQISEGCKSATKSLRDERKTAKAEKAAEKAEKAEEKADK